MSLSAIVIGIVPNEIDFTLKSFEGAGKYIDEIIVVHSCQEPKVDFKKTNGKNYPNVKIYRTKKLGICAAFNFGLSKASSEYVVFVNSGDELILEGLISAKSLLATSPDVISSAVSIYSPTTNTSIMWTGLDPKGRIGQIHQQGSVYRKSLHEIHGTYSSLFKCAMDTAFFSAVMSSKAKHKIVYNPKPVVKFFTGGTSFINKHQTVLEYALIKTIKSKKPIQTFLISLPILTLKLIVLKIKQFLNINALRTKKARG